MQNNNLRDERKYSKKAFVYGLIGMGIFSLDTYLSGSLGVESLFKEIKELNTYEIMNNVLFGVSSISTLLGGTMYGISHMDNAVKIQEVKKEIKDIEKKL